ncbi:DNA topoisomerase 3 [Chlamydiales bacterium SCGC AG-110-P3]|nr:DNA topoisomerase 3 [Chlamydiales bacterium SCGC AG-110-P3]
MIVIVAEKPSVARDLARVLGARNRHEGYIEGNGYTVTWAFGHLVELVEPDEYDPTLKRWSLESLPILPNPFRLKVSSGKGIAQQFNIIKRLIKSANSLICATDAGREGELIFRYIQRLCKCESKPAQRLWVSSLTDAAIRDGFRNLKPLSNYDNLAAAATCRSQADWIVGLNATRGYSVQHSHGRGVLSVGRVQTPILALIVNRDILIREFKPEDYWELWTCYRDVKFKHTTDRFKVKTQAETLLSKVQSNPFQIVQVEEKTSSQPPPLLFDLTELQRTLNRLYSLSATQTLQLAQSLYEKKYLSYPRTDSRYLTDDLYSQCSQTLGKLSSVYPDMVAPLALDRLNKSKRIFNNAKVNDHHAIIPTGQLPSQLNRDETLVYQAIVTRFIAVFYPNCDKAHTIVHGSVLDERFKTKGTRIVSPGWFALYQSEKKEKKEDRSNDEEQTLPPFQPGEQGTHEPEVKVCRTKPPKHYTEATLLSAMETAGKTVDDEELKEAMKERGLGTPATRAAVIETLFKREYIRKEKKTLSATEKGEELIRLLGQQRTLTSAELTAEWEHRLKQIEKGQSSADDFMKRVRDFTTHIIETLKGGAEAGLTDLGQCPLCKKPIIKGNTGYGCSGWKTGCGFRFHAEQFGTKLNERDVQSLMYKGRLTYPRKLVDAQGQETQGYITIDQTGRIGVVTREAKIREDALGQCPLCSSSVIEKFQCYSCTDCDFAIWKKIAKRPVSKTLAQILMSKGRSQVLKGFRSKAGKPFSAALVLKDGKVSFEFGPRAEKKQSTRSKR